MSALVAVLHEARARIADPARWMQKVLARDSEGDECDPQDDDACCWCAIGAIEALPLIGEIEAEAADALDQTARSLGYGRGGEGSEAAHLNDAPETTHADVLALYDLAIERAEQAAVREALAWAPEAAS